MKQRILSFLVGALMLPQGFAAVTSSTRSKATATSQPTSSPATNGSSVFSGDGAVIGFVVLGFGILATFLVIILGYQLYKTYYENGARGTRQNRAAAQKARSTTKLKASSGNLHWAAPNEPNPVASASAKSLPKKDEGSGDEKKGSKTPEKSRRHQRTRSDLEKGTDKIDASSNHGKESRRTSGSKKGSNDEHNGSGANKHEKKIKHEDSANIPETDEERSRRKKKEKKTRARRSLSSPIKPQRSRGETVLLEHKDFEGPKGDNSRGGKIDKTQVLIPGTNEEVLIGRPKTPVIQASLKRSSSQVVHHSASQPSSGAPLLHNGAVSPPLSRHNSQMPGSTRDVQDNLRRADTGHSSQNSDRQGLRNSRSMERDHASARHNASPTNMTPHQSSSFGGKSSRSGDIRSSPSYEIQQASYVNYGPVPPIPQAYTQPGVFNNVVQPTLSALRPYPSVDSHRPDAERTGHYQTKPSPFESGVSSAETTRNPYVNNYPNNVMPVGPSSPSSSAHPIVPLTTPRDEKPNVFPPVHGGVASAESINNEFRRKSSGARIQFRSSVQSSKGNNARRPTVISAWTKIEATMINSQNAVALPAFLSIDLSKFNVDHVIAKGGTSFVASGSLPTQGLPDSVVSRAAGEQKVAVKVMRKPEDVGDTDFLSAFRQEVSILYGLEQNPNIVKLIAYSEEPLAIITKLYPSDLKQELANQNDGKWNQIAIKKKIGIDICHGIQALHDRGIIHNDLKTANILIDYDNTDQYKQSPTAILSDFGLAGILDSFAELKAREKNPLVGISLQYAAPEVIRAFDSPAITVDDLGSPESDVYSFGMVFYEIICRMPPFSNVENSDVLKKKILKGERPWFTVAVREQFPEMISVIENCWRIDPSDRYSSFTPIIRSLSG